MSIGTDISNPFFAVVAVFFTGTIAGVCGGYWGIGAGWMVVPVLILLGMNPAVAVGVSLIHMAVKSIQPAFSRFKDIGWERRDAGPTVAIPMTISAFITVALGVVLVELSKGKGSTGALVGMGYCVVLVFIALQCFWAHYRGSTKHEYPLFSEKYGVGSTIGLSFGAGMAAGLISGVLGAGGGIIWRPTIQHVLRLSETRTAAISQLLAGVTALFAGVLHITQGNVIVSATIVLSVGGVIGQTLGMIVGRRAVTAGKGHWANFTFGLAVVGILAAQILELMNMRQAGRVWLVAVGVVICVLIIIVTLPSHRIAKTVEESDEVSPLPEDNQSGLNNMRDE